MSTPGAHAGGAPFLLRDPTLSKTHIAFSYGGNIWIADHNGEDLRRLTSEGYESLPAFSPDGTQIAFVAEYGGPRGVFVLPRGGGAPRRLTYHPDDLGLSSFCRTGNAVGWTPDGKNILFSSRRQAYAGGSLRITQLFLVPVEGGRIIRVPLEKAAQGVFSPDAKLMAYVPNTRWQPEWKRYRGGGTTPIWIADLATSNVEARIPRDNSNDFNPMWVADQIYFLSDRKGTVTVFSYDLKSGQVRQIVENDGFDIKSASACAGVVAYEKFGSLHLFDLKSGEDRVLDIRPRADFPELRPRFKSVTDVIGSIWWYPEIKPTLSPTGDSAAFSVRGEVLTISPKSGVRNLTRTTGVVERDPVWSPDGRFMAYFSDESGEYALHVREIGEQIDAKAVRKVQLGDPPGFYHSPTWSPDGTKIAYLDKALNYWYVDLEAKIPVLVDTDLVVDLSHLMTVNAAPRLAWSPDSRWIAYSKILVNQLHAIFAYSIDNGKSDPLTDGTTDALHPAFDRGGEYLYFTASINVGLAGDLLAMSSFDRYRSVTCGVYAVILRSGEPSPMATQSVERTGSATQSCSNLVRIDLENVSKRVERLPVADRNYGGVFAGSSGSIFLTEELPVIGIDFRQKQNVHRFDLATRKSAQILRDVTYFELSRNAEMALYARVDETPRRRWFTTSMKNLTEGDCAAGQNELRSDTLQVYIDPRSEWTHIYDQAWRQFRHFAYDPGLHGLDLEKTKSQYRPFLENIVCRNDLTYLLGEMLANITLGHVWADDGLDARKRAKTGLLGADYHVDHGRYRFAQIYEADAWNSAVCAPLAGPGMHVQVGEYLLAVDGRDVWASADIYSYFEETAGQSIALRVGPSADGQEARDIIVVPINDEYPLRYFAWIEANRRKVDALTAGRVAYVHVPNCLAEGYEAFNRFFFAQVGKEALVLDARYNNGGKMPDYIIECLSRQPLCYWSPRHGLSRPEPLLGIFGPKVMLINEMNFSMGEVLPWLFRRAGLGPLVGRRTVGGSVGFHEKPYDIIDYGYIAAPNLAFHTPEGAWEIENRGVSPDIELEQDSKAARAGLDMQLQKAIEVVMDLLKTNPAPTRPQRAPFPNYHD
jgi:tricorn protease